MRPNVRPRPPDIRYVAAVSPGDAAAIRDCQALFANFAQTVRRPPVRPLAAGVAEDATSPALLLAAPQPQRLPVLLFASVHWLLLSEPERPASPASIRTSSPPDTLRRRPRATPSPPFDRSVWRAPTISSNSSGRDAHRPTRSAAPPCSSRRWGDLAADHGPLAHVDVGASAGLNMLIGHYGFVYEAGGTLRGSGVTITCATRGGCRSRRAPGHRGSDRRRHRPDRRRRPRPGAVAGGLRVARPRRALRPPRAAIEVATTVGVDVRRGDATETVAALIAEAGLRPPRGDDELGAQLPPSRGPARFVADLDEAGGCDDIDWLYAESPAICPELPGMPRRGRGRSSRPRWSSCAGGRREAGHVADAHPHGRWLHWVGCPSGSPTRPCPVDHRCRRVRPGRHADVRDDDVDPRRRPTLPPHHTSKLVLPQRSTVQSRSTRRRRSARSVHVTTAFFTMKSNVVVVAGRTSSGQRGLEPPGDGVVGVRQVVGVEHHALHVALAVAHRDRVAERHRARPPRDDRSPPTPRRCVAGTPPAGRRAARARPARRRASRTATPGRRAQQRPVRARLGGDQFGQRRRRLDVPTHELADDRVGIAERRAPARPATRRGRSRDSSRRRRPPPCAAVTNVAVSIIPASAASASDTWSTESNSGSLSSCRSRLYASGSPLSVASRPVRLPMSRPALPRASSAMSGFFFCGSIDDPVA